MMKRRDFLSGSLASVAALMAARSAAAFDLFGSLAGLETTESAAEGADIASQALGFDWIYPPARQGLRGAHDGSFEVLHQLARAPIATKAASDKKRAFEEPAEEAFDFAKAETVDGFYDLVIVGAGLSGLTAAYEAQKRLGPQAKILLLDNHDDFGGHAKRNEFEVAGKRLIAYGGSQSMDGPRFYSARVKALLTEIGIESDYFYRAFDRSFATRHGLGYGLYLDEANYGERRLLRRALFSHEAYLFEQDEATDRDNSQDLDRFIEGLLVPASDKKALRKLWLEEIDWLAPMAPEARVDYLRRHSFEALLARHLGITDTALQIIRKEAGDFWALGFDALSGLEALRMGYPGTAGLGLDRSMIEGAYQDSEPYIFHFPDGNAMIARLLVQRLVPEAFSGLYTGLGGKDQAKSRVAPEAILTSHIAYDRLDRAVNPCRIRLGASVLRLQNKADGVEVIYGQNNANGNSLERVEARAVIYAGWSHVLPFIAPELGDEQKQALDYGEKTPLTYVNVALKNWRAFKAAGLAKFYAPQRFLSHVSLDYPVNMAGYLFSKNPDEPIIVHMVHCPAVPGLMLREQLKAGRYAMLSLDFDDYEEEVKAVLNGALGPFGFDAERDIAAITVNRWPHGYAYEYSDLADPWDYSRDYGPHIKASAPIGKIAIAGSDARAHAYLDGAVEAAFDALDYLYNKG